MIPASKLVEKLSEELKKHDNIKTPDWALYIKTGVNIERPPVQPNWWYLRSAAVLRRIHVHGPIGVQRLRNALGSRKRRGHKPAHHAKAGGKIIRTMLQQLEKDGLVKKVERPKKGRLVTSKGQKLIDKVSKGI